MQSEAAQTGNFFSASSRFSHRSITQGGDTSWGRRIRVQAEAEGGSSESADAKERRPLDAFPFPFELDSFQREAIDSIENGTGNILVCAHTSAGKTAVAQYACAAAVWGRQKVVYTSPIKALSNQKYRQLQADSETFGGQDQVGIVTGDASVNPNGNVVVMTTEVLRNQLYAGSATVKEGQAAFLTDEERQTLAGVPGLEVPAPSFWREATLGSAFKGTLLGESVAVEKIRVPSAEADDRVSAMVSAMNRGVSHGNIRKSFGKYLSQETTIDTVLLVLELCESDLTRLIRERGPASTTIALSVVWTVADALNALPIPHGNLKLETVLMKGRPKSLSEVCNSIRLYGFGLAGGASQYLAPEQ